jgi:beta-fructofuranosidase
MTQSPLRVGVLVAGEFSDEQRAAFEWLDARDGVAVDAVPFEAAATVAAVPDEAGRATATHSEPRDLVAADSPAADPSVDESLGGSYPGPGIGDRDDEIRRYDVLWWHRAAPHPDADPLADAAGAIDDFLADGGGLLLTLGAMASVDRLSVESVPPDRVGDESLAEPTGVLWRSTYADHPALAALDGLRHPLRARGTVPAVRYERVLPERGEVLASTVRGDSDAPDQMTAVSWSAGDGAVLGLGAPVLFAEPPADDGPAADRFAETRDRLVTGCLRSLAVDGGTPGRPTTAADMRRLRERVYERTAGPTGVETRQIPPDAAPNASALVGEIAEEPIRRFMNGSESTVLPAATSVPLYRIEVSGDPGALGDDVSDFRSIAFVTADGLVLELSATYVHEPTGERVRVAFRYARLDDTVAIPPPWYWEVESDAE